MVVVEAAGVVVLPARGDFGALLAGGEDTAEEGEEVEEGAGNGGASRLGMKEVRRGDRGNAGSAAGGDKLDGALSLLARGLGEDASGVDESGEPGASVTRLPPPWGRLSERADRGL